VTHPIELEHVSKDYGPVRGLNDVTLKIGPGVTGLLGPNGAGKSTLIRLITGQIRQDQGTVRVLGEGVYGNHSILARVGCCPDIEKYNNDWTGYRFVFAACYLSGFSRSDSRARALHLLELVGLAQAAGRPIGSYSKGMRQRAKFAQALVNDPEVLILDEPLTGLDPVGRIQMLELMRALGDAGRCVLVSSHVLHEVEAVTDDVVLIHHGKVVAEGRVRDIRALLSRHPLKITVRAPRAREMAARFVVEPGVTAVHMNEDSVTIETQQPLELFGKLESLVVDEGLDVRAVTTPDESLEAVFDYLVK
jgi:ABC-2 type transport system ATP-binding protein